MQRSVLMVILPFASRENVGQPNRSMAGMHPLAAVLIDLYMLLPITGFPALFTGEFEHAGVARDDHTEFVHGRCLNNQVFQLGLLIGIHLEDMFDAEGLPAPAGRGSCRLLH